MPFVYPRDPLRLIGTPPVGSGDNRGQCAALAQNCVPGLENVFVAEWKRGEKVKGNQSLLTGTVIAVFDTNGCYVGQSKHSYLHGIAHTALYVRQSAVGVEVIHQYRTQQGPCRCIQGALIRFGGGSVAGHHPGVSRQGGTPEDDANNYYVVELHGFFGGNLELFDPQHIAKAPPASGVYVVWKEQGKLVPFYVGRSRVSVRNRLISHFQGLGNRMIARTPKNELLFECEQLISEEQLEANMIKELGTYRVGNLRRETDPADRW